MVTLKYAATPDQLFAVARETEAIDGVTSVVMGYQFPDEDSNDILITQSDATSLGFQSVPDSTWLALDAGVFTAPAPPQRADLSATSLRPDQEPEIAFVFVQTTGASSAIEQARTVLQTSPITSIDVPPMTRVEMADSSNRILFNSFVALAYPAMGIATLIAALSLTVATIATILDRKRVMGLLRLIGMPVSSLRRMITFETAVPLHAVTALAAILGFLTAWLMMTGLTQGRRSISWPDIRYFIALAASIALSMAAVAATFSTIRRNTALTATRFE